MKKRREFPPPYEEGPTASTPLLQPTLPRTRPRKLLIWIIVAAAFYTILGLVFFYPLGSATKETAPEDSVRIAVIGEEHFLLHFNTADKVVMW